MARTSAKARRSTSASRPTTPGFRCASWASASRLRRVINADVYLLTPNKPSILPLAKGLNLERSEQASDSLMADLRADKGGEWIPDSSMWLSFLRIDALAGDLDYDLAVDVGGEAPSTVDAGIEAPPVAPADPPAPTGLPDMASRRRGRAGSGAGHRPGRGFTRRAPA